MNERGTFVEVMLQGPTGDWAWMGGEVSRDQERPPEAEAEAGCLPGREGGGVATRACIRGTSHC